MVYAQERDREDVKHKRELWTAKQPHTNCNSLVFLDKSGMNIDLTRRYGRGRRASRVWDKVPLNTPKSTTLLSSIRLDGDMICSYFQGAMTGDIFLNYVREQLVPHLRAGDIVVMDNLRAHKVHGVQLICRPTAPILTPLKCCGQNLRPFYVKSKLVPLLLCILLSLSLWGAVTLSDIAAWFLEAGYSLA